MTQTEIQDHTKSENTDPNTTTNVDTTHKQIPFDVNGNHPLLHSWTLYYDGQQPTNKKGNWGENIKEVYTIASVEDFWRLYNNVTLASQLQLNCNYNLFKQGIQPKWEDAANEKGGKWTINIRKERGLLDRCWLWLLLACIGEQLDDDQNQICGAVVNVRKGQDRLCLWTKDADNKDAILKLGHSLKKALELPDVFTISYSTHNSRSNKFDI